MRLTNLSLAGAAIEGAFRDPIPGPLKLQVEWRAIVLTLDCQAVDWCLSQVPPTLHASFQDVTTTQSLLLKALIEATVAEGGNDSLRPPPRRRWLRLISD